MKHCDESLYEVVRLKMQDEALQWVTAMMLELTAQRTAHMAQRQKAAQRCNERQPVESSGDADGGTMGKNGKKCSNESDCGQTRQKTEPQQQPQRQKITVGFVLVADDSLNVPINASSCRPTTQSSCFQSVDI